MSWLADQPVQRKLSFAMLFTSTSALVAACGVFLAVQYGDYRQGLAHTVATLARITADNSTAAIAFSDKAGALQNLEALRAEPQVTAAILYDADGQVFARYATDPAAALPKVDPLRTGLRFEAGFMVEVEPVVEGSRRLGTLYLRVSMAQIYDRMRSYGWIVFGVLVASFGLAGVIAAVLRRTLAGPIVELANTAGTISASQDYSLRARQYSRDELGRLTTAFNAMLEKTQNAVGALRESEWAHRELVRALPAAAYMCDTRGMITLYNDAAVELWGRSPEMGREYWCGSYRMYTADGVFLPLDQSPLAIALKQGRPVRDVEIIIERPDGSRRNVLPHPEPVRDTSGTLVGVVNMLVDITDRKRADAAVRQLAAIVTSSDDAIISKNLDGIITSWNKGAEALFGYKPGEIIGESVLRLIPPELQDEEPGIIARVRRGEPIEHYETVRCRKDGSRIDVSLTVSPMRDNTGRIVGASKIARDITQRKRIEDQANFLSQLSQELSARSEPGEIIRAASGLIGGHLGADRCFFCTPAVETGRIQVEEDWHRDGFASAAGSHAIADFGSAEMAWQMTESPQGVADETADPRANPEGFRRLRIAAHASAPFLRGGRWVASLVVASEHPRAWRPDEIALLENALARVWPMAERARSRRELQESERRQRELMQALPVACYTIDAAGKLTFFNDAAVQLWGRVPVLGEVLWDSALAMRALDGSPFSAEQSPMRITLREKRPVRGVEAMLVRPDGSRRWVAPNPDPLFDAQGECIGLVNVVLDVTEARTAQENILKVAERLNLAIASAKLGDWNWDAATDLLTMSPRTSEIYGVPAGPPVTRSGLRELLHPEDRERARAELQRAVETRADYDIEYRVLAPGGAQRWVAAKGRSIFGPDGRITGMVGVAQDITERKQAEIELKRARDEALAASQAKDEFLAALSHELRTPLNPVLLLASNAASSPDLPPSVRADFNVIHKNVALEARLIDDLLDLTRITHGKLKLDQHRCDLHVVLRDAIANVQADLTEKKLELSLGFKAKECIVLGDSVRLQQVFWNILKNAVKFTPEGGRIAIETQSSREGIVTAKIADTGIGMTPAEIDRVFMAFTQGDHAIGGSASHRFGGLGLGLAITKMLVEMHGGQVRAASTGRDQGSTFTIELPLCRALGEKLPAAGSASPVAPASSGRSTSAPIDPARRRILLVEDHAPTRLTLQQLLKQRRFEVVSAGSADEAVRLAQGKAFDLLISDVGLPGRNGYDLMADLRRSNPSLPGIALSGYGMEDDLARSHAAGFSVHLVKPVTMDRLEEAIARLLPSAVGAEVPNSSPS
ncbi:MAG TPA: PAS domain S-box protein [Opitutaceae bacterium]|nr:PAS domain S-box protein [Opitutaceae bacterium]